jgi:hypothetical protein
MSHHERLIVDEVIQVIVQDLARFTPICAKIFNEMEWPITTALSVVDARIGKGEYVERCPFFLARVFFGVNSVQEQTRGEEQHSKKSKASHVFPPNGCWVHECVQKGSPLTFTHGGCMVASPVNPASCFARYGSRYHPCRWYDSDQ